MGNSLHQVGEDELVVLSQEEILSQTKYIYKHPRLLSTSHAGLDLRLLNGVLKLQIAKKGKLLTYGTVVVFTKEGLCLTANHCLEANASKEKVNAPKVKINTSKENVNTSKLKIDLPAWLSSARLGSHVKSVRPCFSPQLLDKK
jgi:hypothetical protein